MHPHANSASLSTHSLRDALEQHAAGQPVWSLFTHKVRGHMEAFAGLPSRRLPPPAAWPALCARLDQPATRSRTIYLHVPFCRRICTFCAFFRKPTATADLESYTEAALAQIKAMAQTRWAQNGPPFQAVYFGGGTPTALTAQQLRRLVHAISAGYRLASDGEFTVECRFDGLDQDMLQALRDAGVNRLSFGVQSFDTATRQGVGRLADRKQVIETLTLADRVGFQGISVDLIYNLPDQSLACWQKDLATLQQTPVTAASVYALIPMPGSALVKQIEAGRQEPLGDCQRQYDMFAHAYDQLISMPRWRQFSFHHFGDKQRERNIYNQVRSGSMDTLGLGCGGGGVIGTLSYMNAMDVEAYTRTWTQSEAPQCMGFEQPEGVIDACPVYALTESAGIGREQFLRCLPDAKSLLNSLHALGLIHQCDDCIHLTREGSFWGYNITALLTQAIAADLGQPSSPAGSHHLHHISVLQGAPHGK